jgi:hypothetical protein
MRRQRTDYRQVAALLLTAAFTFHLSACGVDGPPFVEPAPDSELESEPESDPYASSLSCVSVHCLTA